VHRQTAKKSLQRAKSGRLQKTRNAPSWSAIPPPPVWGSQYRPSTVKEKKYAAELRQLEYFNSKSTNIIVHSTDPHVGLSNDKIILQTTASQMH
jgi:hypothetical protein